MLQQGAIRNDGFIFKSYYRDKNGIKKEQWLSPNAWKKWQLKRNECNRINYHKNIEKSKEKSKLYHLNNKHKGNARAAKRRAIHRHAYLKWLTIDQQNEIKLIYHQAKLKELAENVKYEVDHIEPLQGKDVCGLHVPWNLQILPMQQNRSKGIKRGIFWNH